MKSVLGINTWIKRFDTTSLELFYLVYATISFFNMIYTLLQEFIHDIDYHNLAMTLGYYLNVGHFISVVYSLLVTKDEIYRYGKMRRHKKKQKMFEKTVISEMDQRLKNELKLKMKTFRENLA